MPRNRNPELPTVDKLIKGRVYATHCRNLLFGVWDGDRGFIGIRTKLGSRYLFTEYHWDADPHCGTVANAKDTGVDVPDGIVIKDDLGTIDDTGRQVTYDRELKNNVYADTKEPCPPYPNHFRVVHNNPLFEFLDTIPSRCPDPFK